MEQSDRYPALDVLRGMTIALMILVNTPGSWQYVYSPLRHAEWHGCTPADLVFPFFLFAVGASLFFSFYKNQTTLTREALIRTGRRVLLIFLIGIFINSYPQWMTDFSQFRIMGVLQRIALAYGMTALIVLIAPRRRLPFVVAAILLIYWAILYFLGGSDPYSLHTNAAIAFDGAILGESHLYQGFGIPFDPEGILSSLPSVATVLTGYLAGIMIAETARDRAPVQLSLFGIVFTIAGYLWGFVFPVNKPLWTSSYVLYTAGLASLLFALLIYLIDLRGYKKWSLPFSVFGRNPLFLFILSVIWGKTLRLLIHIPDGRNNTLTGSAWLYQNVFAPPAGNLNGSLAYAMAHIIFFWLIGYVLYKRRIFVKV